MPASKEMLRLLERAKALRAYVTEFEGATQEPERAPLSREERRFAMEFLLHVDAGGDPELWARQHAGEYQRLFEVAPPRARK